MVLLQWVQQHRNHFTDSGEYDQWYNFFLDDSMKNVHERFLMCMKIPSVKTVREKFYIMRRDLKSGVRRKRSGVWGC